MQYSIFDNIARPISKLGFGLMRLPKVSDDSEVIDRDEAFRLIDLAMEAGVNYYDTAFFYHGGDSEKFACEALSRYPRESFCLATKLPGGHMKDHKITPEEIFNGQLKKCGVDYFDFYLLHAVNRDIMVTFEEYKSYEYLSEQKKAGRIKYLGFSYHGDFEFFVELVDKYKWDFVQLQINYYDWDANDAKAFYDVLAERNIPCIVMEPVRGGSLHKLNDEARAVFDKLGDASYASYALRYVAQLPNVLTTLSGMSTYEQVEDNLKTFKDLKPLSEIEMNAVEEANVHFRKNFAIPCTDCKYCVEHCPANVDIPLNFKAYNEYNKTRDLDDFHRIYNAIPEGRQCTSCIECGVCKSHCPQQIDIPKSLKKVSGIAK